MITQFSKTWAALNRLLDRESETHGITLDRIATVYSWLAMWHFRLARVPNLISMPTPKMLVYDHGGIEWAWSHYGRSVRLLIYSDGSAGITLTETHPGGVVTQTIRQERIDRFDPVAFTADLEWTLSARPGKMPAIVSGLPLTLSREQTGDPLDAQN